MEFKEGDRVIFDFGVDSPKGIVRCVHDSHCCVIRDDGANGTGCNFSWYSLKRDIKLLTETNKNKTMIENLKENFILALTSEPKKSFRKAGITNGDDILTDDGARIFLSWLLHSKYAEPFKAEVVDEMLKEEK